MNKEQEVEYSSIFLTQINGDNGWDYKAIPNQDEAVSDHEVDVYAESESHEKLRLQVKIIDKGYMPDVVSRTKEADQNPDGASSVHVRDLDPIKWAKQTIAECNHKYEPGVRKNLVLLLCVYRGGKMDQEYAKKEFVGCQQSDFKAIYLVDPPTGQITPIKPLAL